MLQGQPIRPLESCRETYSNARTKHPCYVPPRIKQRIEVRCSLEKHSRASLYHTQFSNCNVGQDEYVSLALSPPYTQAKSALTKLQVPRRSKSSPSSSQTQTGHLPETIRLSKSTPPFPTSSEQPSTPPPFPPPQPRPEPKSPVFSTSPIYLPATLAEKPAPASSRKTSHTDMTCQI